MKRLTEQSFPAETPESKLAALVARAAPFRANPFRKRMLLQRLSRAAEKPALGFAKPAFALLALAVLGTAGVAGASYGWFGNREEPAPVAVSQVAPNTPSKPVSVPRKAPAVEEKAELPTPEPAKSSEAARNRRPGGLRSRAVEGEDPSEVLEAIRALRKQGDAARAQVLLDQYLKTHPSGALSEQALVLSIEAALARHDPRASDYARRYLARFPNGRYRSLAQRVLGTQQ
ncbi:MAG: hypothetical protein ACOY0T_23485 [Myxococcota bacterium]